MTHRERIRRQRREFIAALIYYPVMILAGAWALWGWLYGG